MPAGTKVYKGSKKTGAKLVVDTTTQPIKNVEGEQVGTVKSTPTPPQAQATREEILKEAARKGQRLTTQQQTELYAAQEEQRIQRAKTEKQTITIAIDMKALEKQREALKALGVYDNYLDYLNGTFTPRAEQNQEIFTTSQDVWLELPPRRASPEETMPIVDAVKFENPFPEPPDYGGQTNIYEPSQPVKRNPAIQFYENFKKSKNDFMNLANKPGNEPLKVLALPVDAAYTLVESSVEAGKGAYEFLRDETPKLELYSTKPWKERDLSALDVNAWAEFEGKIVSGVVSGIGETASSLVGNVQTGNAQGIVETGTSAYVQGELSGVALRGLKATAKGVASTSSHAKFIELTEFPPQTPFEFKTERGYTNTNPFSNLEPSYSRETGQRLGVLVPPEYKGAYGLHNAPELQTQIEPKRVREPYIRSDIPLSDYKPMSLSQVAQQNPQLARMLAEESGQTRLFPEEPISTLRDLTFEERLAVAKEQVGAGKELQKTLLGLPPANRNKFVILKDNKPYLERNGQQLEIKEPPIFAVTDPFSAAAITIYNEREGITTGIKDLMGKFRRESEIVAGNEVFITAKGEGAAGFLFERREATLGATAPIVTSFLFPKSKTGSKGALTPIEISSSIVGEDTKPATRTGQRQRAKQITSPATQTTQITEQTTSQVFTPPRPDIYRPRTPPRPQTPTSQKRFILPAPRRGPSGAGLGGYNVFLRVRGKFQKLNQAPLTKAEALKLGSYRAGSTSAASFRLRPAGRPATGKYNGPGGFLQDFVLKGSTYIEQRSKRINTPGEVQQISFQGGRKNYSLGLAKMRLGLIKKKRKNPFI